MKNDDDYDGINGAKIFTIVIASISCIFPLSVVFILLQKYSTLVRGKSLIYYILMIAISDFAQAITVCFLYAEAGPLCSTISFLNLFACRMSFFYTDVLIFQLFSLVVFKRFFLNARYMDLIVFSLNILLQFLPYSTNTTYGRNDDGTTLVVCSFQGSPNDVDYWNTFAFSIEFFSSFVFIVIFSVIIVYYSIRIEPTTSSEVYLSERI